MILHKIARHSIILHCIVCYLMILISMVWYGMVWHCMVWTEIRAANMALCAGAAFHIIESTQWRAEGGPADRNIILSFLLNCQNISTFTIQYPLVSSHSNILMFSVNYFSAHGFANSAILVVWGPDPIYIEVQYMLTFISKKYWGVKKIESFSFSVKIFSINCFVLFPYPLLVLSPACFSYAFIHRFISDNCIIYTQTSSATFPFHICIP